jgi:hypothetical protein
MTRKGWIRHHLSSNHLYSAYLLAECAARIERAETRADEQRAQHRSYVISSIISSVAFLEAAVNELYVVCAEHPEDFHVAGHPQDSRFGSIGADAIRLLGAIWQTESFQRSAQLLEKCQIALRLAQRPEFEKGSNPYQDAKLAVDLRNLLVHFKPEQREVAGGAGAQLPPDEIESKYRSKFAVNPLALNDPLLGVSDADYPFFPEKCLGSDCARWCFRSILAFADELFRRLGTAWYYHWMFDCGRIPQTINATG